MRSPRESSAAALGRLATSRAQSGDSLSTSSRASSGSNRTLRSKADRASDREYSRGPSVSSSTALNPMPLWPMPSPGFLGDSPNFEIASSTIVGGERIALIADDQGGVLR